LFHSDSVSVVRCMLTHVPVSAVRGRSIACISDYSIFGKYNWEKNSPLLFRINLIDRYPTNGPAGSIRTFLVVRLSLLVLISVSNENRVIPITSDDS